ncbi:hypothetical protein [Asaia sp. As-1742]|uniref:hypothetical protein n=1 Tax=Asaia sp. As-1742 TaxID=2608325 RepID=UPI00141F47D4|nr:hypothetical protein [Asaia sp. As-1742]NIE81554.1 hypothetical protein [Asaia sp. As-1742]
MSRSLEIATSYHAMRAIWPDGIFALNYETSWEDRRDEDWIIPLPHRVPFEMQRRFADLHAQLGLNGIEDVLKGVCESISLSRRSPVRSKPDIERPDNPKLS